MSQTVEQTATIDLDSIESGTSLWEDAWNRLKRNKLAMFGLCVVSFAIVIALLTPWIAPYSYFEQND